MLFRIIIALAFSIGVARAETTNPPGPGFGGDGSSLTNLNGSAITSGTVPAARGGAGAVNGVLKANGAGSVSAATASDLPFTQSGTGAASSTVDARLKKEIYVTDFSGVDPTGATDSATGFQAALDAVVQGQKTLRVPKGTYKLGTTLIMNSNTAIVCSQGSTLKPTKNQLVFVNRNYDLYFTAPTVIPPETQKDHDLSIEGCTFNLSDAINAGSNNTAGFNAGLGASMFLWAERIKIKNNYVIGDITGAAQYLPNGFRFPGDFDFEVQGNNCYGTYNCIGVWRGSERFAIFDNYMNIAYAGANAGAAHSCMNINGSGFEGEHYMTQYFDVHDNVCYTNGGLGTPSTAVVIAYNNGPLTSGSAMKFGSFHDNVLVASGDYNQCYVSQGDNDSVDILNNIFIGCNKGEAIRLTSRATSWGSSTDSVTTDGSTSVTVAIPAVVLPEDCTTQDCVTVGDYAQITMTTFNGMSTGYYKVTAVAAGQITVLVPGGTTGSGTGGGTVSVNTWFGEYRNSKIAGNKFINISAPDLAVLYVRGPGNTIADNTFEGGTYGGMVVSDYTDCCQSTDSSAAPTALRNNKGPIGTGIASPYNGLPITGDAHHYYNSTQKPQIAVSTASTIQMTDDIVFDAGTTTDSRPIQITQTWNNIGVGFRIFNVDVTDTQSATQSYLYRYSYNGGLAASVDKFGAGFFAGGVSSGKQITTPASTTAIVPLSIPHGVAPSSPAQGAFWTTTSGFFSNINGSVVQWADLQSAQTFSGAKTFSSPVTISTGTLTASAPGLNLTQTWDNAAVGFVGALINITDTASSNASFLQKWQVGGVDKAKISKNGAFQILSNMQLLSDTGNLFFGASNDVIVSRKAAAALQLGSADAAAPVAQTLGVQSVVAGTTDTAGADWTFTGSQGTGTGAGGKIKFRVAPAGSTGSAQNALADALTINADKSVVFASNITIGDAAALIKSSVAMNNGAAAQTGTLTNAPAAGNPTKWIPVNDNGTTRYIPAW